MTYFHVLTGDDVERDSRAAAGDVSSNGRVGEGGIDLASGVLAEASLTAEERRVGPGETAAGDGGEGSNDGSSLPGAERGEDNTGVDTESGAVDGESAGGAEPEDGSLLAIGGVRAADTTDVGDGTSLTLRDLLDLALEDGTLDGRLDRSGVGEVERAGGRNADRRRSDGQA